MGLKTVKSTIAADAQALAEQTGDAGGCIQQAVDVANGFATGSTATLTGQAWDAARDFVVEAVVPVLQGLDAINEAMGDAGGILSTQADALIKEKLDEDKLTKAYNQFKAQRDGASDQMANGHMTDPDAVKQETKIEQNAQDGMDTVDKELKSLHDFESGTSSAFDGVAEVISGIRQGLKAIDSQLNGRGELDTQGMNLFWAKGLSKATAKLRDGTQKRLVSMFESMGMTETQAKEAADFTKRFHEYAAKQQEEGAPEWRTGRDIAWQYARYLAGMTDKYGGPLWQTAGGVPDTPELNALLEALGYKPDKQGKYKLVTDMNAAHGNGDGVDFMHEMGALACMLNNRPGAGVYHIGTSSREPVTIPGTHTPMAGPDRQPIYRTDEWYKESATWGGDIASGNAPKSDLISDIDIINIDDRIEANPNADPQAIISQYYNDINSHKADRVTLFCAHYGDGNPDKGRQYLHDNLDEIVDEPLGNQYFHKKDGGGDPISPGGPSRTNDAKQRFLDIIDGKVRP